MDTSMLLTLGIVLMAAGLLLLLADLFIPSGGILTLLALGSLGVGVTLLFRHSMTAGLTALGTLFLALPVMIGLLIKFWPHTPIARMAHAPPLEEDGLPMHQELQHLKGRYGKTLTALKPAGMVDFDGRRVDSLTEGMMIEAGRQVRCVEVRGGTVIVRVTDGPEPSNLDTAIFT